MKLLGFAMLVTLTIAKTLDPMQKFSSNRKFEVSPEEGKINLKSASDKYLSRVHHHRGIDFIEVFNNEIEVVDDLEHKSNPSLKILEPYINENLALSLKADNGKYMCIQDKVLKAETRRGKSCNFYVDQNEDGTISLQETEPPFHFLTVRKSSKNLHLNKFSPNSKFKVSSEEGKLVLKAASGKYLSRINYGGIGHTGGIDFIEAAKNKIDIFCKFQVVENSKHKHNDALNAAMEILEPFFYKHLLRYLI